MPKQTLWQMLVQRAHEHWCGYRRGGRPCDHGAVTYLVPTKEGPSSDWACEDHAQQMVATGAWRDARHA